MPVWAYVFVETDVGKARAVGEAVRALIHQDGKILFVDTVTGPFDVIAQIEADDVDKAGRLIADGIQRVAGVRRTTTCLSLRTA